MYLTVHGASGILIGSQIGNPIWAFLLGLISHFALDAIPHDSIESKDWKNKGNFKMKLFLEGAIDILVLILIIIILKEKNMLVLSIPVMASMAGSLLPDFIWAGAEFLKIENSLIEKYKQFHEKAHKLIHKPIFLPLKYVVPIQIISLAIIMGIYILFS